ncbi:hypothetical protein CEH05_19350 [Halobacillus halophilus]|nr:hypothetical protein CEH05_19350 [Halobacillus halophilus]
MISAKLLSCHVVNHPRYRRIYGCFRMPSFFFEGSVFIIILGWWGNEETRAGEGARRDPTGSETTEEACQFPRRKATYFPTSLPLFNVTAPFILKMSLKQTEASLLKNLLVLYRWKI